MTSKIKLDWKLDPVALAALFLALAATTAQIADRFRGPSIKFITPDRVAIYSDSANGSTFVRVAASMSYANVAQAPYGDLVLKERVRLDVGNLSSNQQWNAFGTITRNGPQMTDTAAPQSLPGQSAESHFTLFTPAASCEGQPNCDPKQQFVDPKALVKAFEQSGELRLRFEIELIDGETIRRSCHVPYRESTRQEISRLPISYAYLYCFET
jgi:hypothetical protein